jgi:hypothetical protein
MKTSRTAAPCREPDVMRVKAGTDIAAITEMTASVTIISASV